MAFKNIEKAQEIIKKSIRPEKAQACAELAFLLGDLLIKAQKIETLNKNEILAIVAVLGLGMEDLCQEETPTEEAGE